MTLALVFGVLCIVVVLVVAYVRHRAHAVERETKFWAELHDPPPTVRRFPR